MGAVVVAASVGCSPSASREGGQGEVEPAETAAPTETDPTPETETMEPDTSIVDAQNALTPTVMSLPGVVGTAIGLCDGTPCIQVLLAAPDAKLSERIPTEYRGFVVTEVVVGRPTAQDTTPSD